MRKKVGVINLSGRAYLSDPCYDANLWCNGFIDVKSGRYKVYITYSKKTEYPIVTNLIIIHEEHYKRNFKLPVNDTNLFCAVDSGQCGIFDFDYFINTREECDEDWYLNNIVGDKDFKITDNDGVIVHSGYGDGFYPVFVECDKDKLAYAIRINFVQSYEE